MPSPAQPPRRLAAVAAVALGLVAAGCGESRKEAGSTATTAAAPTTAPASKGDFTVVEREYAIEPADLDVPKTGSFTLAVRNAGSVTHALEVEGPGGEVKTGSIAPGASATLAVKLDKPGRYEWYCPIDGHKDRGMRGTVVVAGGGSAKQESTSEEHKKKKSGGGGYDKGGSSGGASTTGGSPAPSGESTYP